MKSAFDIIDGSPYSPAIKIWVKTLAPALERLRRKPPMAMYSARNALNTLAATMHSQKLYGERLAIVQCVLYTIKRMAATPPEDDGDNHELSDHAFCAAMRRLGYDIIKFKDQAKAEAIAAGLVPVFGVKAGSVKKHQIFTFLPPPPEVTA